MLSPSASRSPSVSVELLLKGLFDIAFRVAKVLDASIYDVIAGRAVPAGTCAHCGKEPSEHWRCEGASG